MAVFIEYEIFCTVGYIVSLDMTIVLCEMLKKCCVFRERCEFTWICVCMYSMQCFFYLNYFCVQNKKLCANK